MQYTENLNLAKYETNDVTSYLEVANTNMTKIDAGHGTLNTQVTANTSAIRDVQNDVDNMAPQVVESTTKANAGLSNTASVYDVTQTYTVGDYVLYNNNLYKCITAVTQAESFDGTKWERVKTSDEIKNNSNYASTLNTKIDTGLNTKSGYLDNTITETVLFPYATFTGTRTVNVPRDGFIKVSMRNSGSGTCKVLINNIEVCAVAEETGVVMREDAIFPCKTNTNITLEIAGSSNGMSVSLI